LLEQLQKEVKELLAKAERADSQGEMDPAKLPAEMAKSQQLRTAKQTLGPPWPCISMNCSAQRSFKEPVERGHRPAAWMRELPTSVFLQIRQAPRLQCVSASPLKNRQTPERCRQRPARARRPCHQVILFKISSNPVFQTSQVCPPGSRNMRFGGSTVLNRSIPGSSRSRSP
jgi:hypothetical protein